MTAALAFAAAALAVAGLALVLRAPPPAPGGVPAPTRSSRRDRAPWAGPRPPGARVVAALAATGRRARPLTAPPELRARIEAAGRPAGLGVRELMAAKAAAALAAAGCAVPFAALAPGRLGLLLGAVGPVAGFLAPDLWLGRLAAERARRVRRDLPATLDMLRVTVAAGGSLAWALGLVGERSNGPLAGELRALSREVALGVPLADALAALAARLPQPEIRALVAALERARRHGAPLAETLAAQARAARFSLARRVRENAARAGPKIQLVVALLLVPSVLLLVAAALAAALIEGRGGALV